MQPSVAVGLMSQQDFKPGCDYFPSWEKRDLKPEEFCVFNVFWLCGLIMENQLLLYLEAKCFGENVL